MPLDVAPEGPLFETGTGPTQHSAAALRRMLKDIFTSPGVIGVNDLFVSQTGSPSFGVQVGPGRALVHGTEASTTQGAYLEGNLVATAVPNPLPAHATLSRIDLVCLRIRDGDYSGVHANDGATFEWVNGIASGSPVAPVANPNSIVLASVIVTPAAGTIVNANITDVRPHVSSAVPRKPYRARMHLSSNMAVGALTPFPFDVLDYDASTPSACALGVGAHYTCPAAGYYVCMGQMSTNPASASVPMLYKNNLFVAMGISFSAATMYRSVVQDIVKCNAGDVLDMRSLSAITAAVGAGDMYLSIAYDGPL